MDDEEAKVKSLIENALHCRFSFGETWDDPYLLGRQFSKDELVNALDYIGKTQRQLQAGGDSIYTLETYERARELVKTAKENVLTFRKLPPEINGMERGNVIHESSDTPQSFHGELRNEQYYRSLARRELDKGERGI